MPKTTKNSSFLSNAAYIFLNRLFINLATLLVMYFYAHKLSQNDYGRYQGFWAQLNVFNVVVGLGIAIFVLSYNPIKLVSLFKRLKKKEFLFYSIFLVIIGFIFGILQYKHDLNIALVLFFLIGFAFTNITDALLIVFQKFKVLVLINVLFAVLFFLIHYLFLFRVFDLNLLLLFLLPLLFLKVIVSGLIIFNTYKDQSVAVVHDNNEMKGMMSLWKHLYIYDMIQVFSLWIDKFIISAILSSEQTAIYINGTLNIPFLPVLFSALTSAAMIHLAHNDKKEVTLSVVKDVGKVLSSVAFPLCIFFLLYSREFIVFFFSDKYVASIPIFICSLLILPARAYGYTVILQIKEKGKIINTGSILDICLAVALMYPLYLIMGLPGVALSFVISTFAQIVYYLVQTKKLLQVSIADLLPVGNWIKKTVGFLILGIILFFLLPIYFDDQMRLFIAAAIMGGSSLYILYIELKQIRQKQALANSQ